MECVESAVQDLKEAVNQLRKQIKEREELAHEQARLRLNLWKEEGVPCPFRSALVDVFRSY